MSFGKVYRSIEEVQADRKKYEEQYESGLPIFLQEFLNYKEQSFIKQDHFREFNKNRNKIIRESTKEERCEFAKDKEEEFWNNNRAELIKRQIKPDSQNKPKYNESKRNEESFEEDKNLSQIDRDAIFNICSKDIYAFACRYFSDYLKKPSSKFHRYLYNFLSREINKVKRHKGFKHAIAAPRGSAKSSLVSCILPIWCICYEKKRFILLLSDTASQAEDFLLDIKRELEGNLLLLQDFPDACEKGSIWRADELITNNNIRILALGTGSKIRGRKLGANRPDLVIGDDLESSDLVRSKTAREFMRYQWFDKDVLQVGERGGVTDFLIVGTILGPQSLLNSLLDTEQYPDWTSRKFIAVINFSNSDLWLKWAELYKDRFDLKRQETAENFFLANKKEMLRGVEVLWPEGDSYYDLMIIKLSNPSGFESEYQNSPVDLTKVKIIADDIHWENFNTNPKIINILGRRNTLYYGAIDPSLGNESSDYPCIVTIARDKATGFLFVVDIYLKKRPIDYQISDIIKLHIKYNYQKFGIETVAFQIVMGDNLRKEARKQGVNLPIEEIKNYKDKGYRFDSIVPLIKDGTIIFDSNKANYNSQYALGMEMLLYFIGDGSEEYDDFPDCLEMGTRVAKVTRFRMIVKSNS